MIDHHNPLNYLPHHHLHFHRPHHLIDNMIRHLDNADINKRDRHYIANRVADVLLNTSQRRRRKIYCNDQATEIVPPYLFVGGQHAVNNSQRLVELGITHILNVAHGLKLDVASLAQANIKLEYIKGKDVKDYNIRKDFARAFAFIDQARAHPNGRVLVNCKRGMSRSSTIVLAYMMCRYNMTLSAALSHVVACRPIVRPNTGFLVQLALFEDELVNGGTKSVMTR